MDEKKRIAVAPSTLRVGLNYQPWNLYGNFLGNTGPIGKAWLRELWTNLGRLHDIGFRVVRIFLLGNAANYGTVNNGVLSLPDKLTDEMKEQLEKMFQACNANDMDIIPSIIDFKAFGKNVILSNGMSNGCTDKYGILDDKHRSTFMNTVVKGFLKIANTPREDDPNNDPNDPDPPPPLVGKYRERIVAWEVMNEPYWNCSRIANIVAPGKLEELTGQHRVDRNKMDLFLAEAIALIEAAGFHSTVGHRFYEDLSDFATGSMRQFHFYPKRTFLGTIKDDHVRANDSTNAFVGEIGVTGHHTNKDGEVIWDHGSPWLQLRGKDDSYEKHVSDGPRVYHRLKLLEKLGYHLALLWPGPRPKGSPFPPDRDPIEAKISPEVQEAVRKFVKGKKLDSY